MAGRITTQLVIEGINKAKKAFADVQKDLSNTESAAGKAGKAVAGALSFATIAAATKAVVDTADAWQLMNARLKLATGSQDEFNIAQKELQRIASATASPIESLVTLYGRISRPLKEAGRSQQDILAVTEAVASAFKVSGASAAEAENGVVQFAQALGSGALRGDEFNSVAEQAPRLMQALADGIGVAVGALKEMAAQGQLTASVVTDALLGELPAIRKELAGFGDTVGGEMVKIGDTLKRGIGQADTGPLKDALKELNETLSDPQTQENLTRLASALVILAEAAAQAAGGLVTFAEDLGYLAARVTGNVDEISRADKEIEKLKSAANGVGILDLYMSDEQIAQRLKEWEAYRDTLIEQQTGMTKEAAAAAKKTSDEVLRIEREQQDALLKAQREYSEEKKRIRDQEVAANEAALKREMAAEKAAQSELEKIRSDRQAIEQRYGQALAELRSGGAGNPSYGAAQSLNVAAEDALRRGDIAGAKSQAQAALKMLQDLAAAGANTYGFEGFIEGLRKIELAANDLEKSNADKSIQAIKDKIVGLQVDAAVLQNMKVSFDLPEAEVERIKAQVQALAETPVVIPVVLQQNTVPGDPDVPMPAYATGGHVRGPGTGTSDSILARLSNGEYVMRAAAVRKWGVNALDRLNGLQLPKFADGGLVSAATQAGSPSLGTINLMLDGQNYTMQAGEQDFASLVRRQRMKRGSTR